MRSNAHKVQTVRREREGYVDGPSRMALRYVTSIALLANCVVTPMFLRSRADTRASVDGRRAGGRSARAVTAPIPDVRACARMCATVHVRICAPQVAEAALAVGVLLVAAVGHGQVQDLGLHLVRLLRRRCRDGGGHGREVGPAARHGAGPERQDAVRGAVEGKGGGGRGRGASCAQGEGGAGGGGCKTGRRPAACERRGGGALCAVVPHQRSGR